MLELIPNQSKVKFIGSDITADVSGINIRGQDRISYEVIYWQDGRKVVWVDAFEIEPVHTEASLKIGFK